MQASLSACGSTARQRTVLPLANGLVVRASQRTEQVGHEYGSEYVEQVEIDVT